MRCRRNDRSLTDAVVTRAWMDEYGLAVRGVQEIVLTTQASVPRSVVAEELLAALEQTPTELALTDPARHTAERLDRRCQLV